MKKLYLLIVPFLFSAPLLFSQPGELDSSFANDGVFLWDTGFGFLDTGQEIVVQPDGKILVAMSARWTLDIASTDCGVARLNEDGSLDSTFAEDGFFRYNNPNGPDSASDIYLFEDGKIMLSGSHGASASNTEFLLYKLNADGAPDSTFANNGILRKIIDASQDYAHSFTFNEEGQIIVAGNSHLPGFNYRRNVVARFEANGVVDSTFGENGVFMWNDDETYNELFNVEMAADGNIFASGRSAPFGTDKLVIYKILEDGSSLDSTWADNGVIWAPHEGHANDMIIHSNGNIMVAGYTTLPVNGYDLLVLSYNQNGTPDMDFGIDGKFSLDLGFTDVANTLFEQPDGKIIAAGVSGGNGFSGDPHAFFSTRLDASGTLDTSWGEAGYIRTETSTYSSFCNAATVQANGKILMTGTSGIPGNNNDLTVIRYGNFIDQDEDGFGLEEDCNDLVFEINPDAEEIVNNDIDEDCDGIAQVIDEDMDGFNSDKDCDDTNADINPDAVEVPYNGLDDDCDVTTPDDDLDGDGFILTDDCDDTNAYINPDADEIPNNEIDEDCDGMDLMVGVNETELAQQFSVFPNPASDIVFIELESTAPRVEFIELFNAAGKKVLTVQTNAKMAIDLEKLPKGMWVIVLHTHEGVTVKRVIKN